MGWKTLLTEEKDGVYVVKLNRPMKKNAYNFDMYEEVIKALKEAEQSPTARVAMITGVGDYFSSGNDLSNFTTIDQTKIPEFLKYSSDMLLRFIRAFIYFPKPLIGAVNGPAIGVAATTLALFDLVYGYKTCTLNTPFMALAQSPEGCSSLLFPARMGALKANEMLLLGKVFTAQEALKSNLLNDVFDDSSVEQFQERVFQIAKKLASFPPGAVQHSKRLIRNKAVLEELDRANQREVELLGTRWNSPECAQAILEFFSRSRSKKASL